MGKDGEKLEGPKVTHQKGDSPCGAAILGAADGEKDILGTYLACGCLDPKSGLYHEGHFRLQLSYELDRLYETEKPLGLFLVKTQEEEGEKGDKLIGFHRELGILLKGILRNSDLIALLSSGELAVIMPRLNFECLERLLERLEGEFSPEGSFKKCHAPLFGVSLVAPNLGLSAQGMMAAARESLQPIKGLKGYLKSQKKLIEGEETALKAEEKELLFQGFSNLWGRGRTS